MRCISCNSVLSYKKRKPASTFAGSMNSVYTDLVEGFPKNEEEDLCTSCLNSIRNYSGDMNDKYDFENYLFMAQVGMTDIEIEDYDSEVSASFEYVQDIYQGYRDK